MRLINRFLYLLSSQLYFLFIFILFYVLFQKAFCILSMIIALKA